MTAAEKEKYGIQAIPMEQLPARAKEFYLDPESVQKQLDTGKPYFYYGTNLPITITVERPTKYEGPVCIK
jgi:hypothetical protein